MGLVSSHEHPQAPQGHTLKKISFPSLSTTPLISGSLCQLGELSKDPLDCLLEEEKSLPPRTHFSYQGIAGTNTITCVVRMHAPALCGVSDDGAGPGSYGWFP